MVPHSQDEKLAQRRFLRKSRFEASMLGSFIRLVDLIVVENLCGLAVRANEEFLSVLASPKTTGLFVSFVEFGSAKLNFTTSAADIHGERWRAGLSLFSVFCASLQVATLTLSRSVAPAGALLPFFFLSVSLSLLLDATLVLQSSAISMVSVPFQLAFA